MTESIELPHGFGTVAEIARRMKMEKVREFGNSPDEEDADIMGYVACLRGGEHIALAYHGPGHQAMRQTVFWSAAMMRCHEIFVIGDARYKTYEPMAAEEFLKVYEAGNLQEQWQAGNREGIKEALMIHRYPILGTPTVAHYLYNRQGTKLTWEHVHQYPADGMQGAIYDHAQAGWRLARVMGPKLQAQIDKNAREMELTLEEQRFHTDRALARALSQQTGVFLVTTFEAPEATFVRGHEADTTDDAAMSRMWEEVTKGSS
jgi:hypothetical protein